MKTPPRFIILAAGEQSWNVDGKPRHLVEIDGESIIGRTVRLFGQHGEVVISGPDDDRYRELGAPLHVLERQRDRHETESATVTLPLWGTGRTVLLLGDIWFSQAAVDTITGFRGSAWQLFGREGASERTGGPWGEPWAFSFLRNHQAKFIRAMAEALAQRGKTYPAAAWWETYRALEGWPPSPVHRVGRHFTEIDDWTQDFDTREQLRDYLTRRASA